MKVTKAITAVLVVFKRDWNKFKGGDFTLTFGLNGGSDVSKTINFSTGSYGGGDQNNTQSEAGKSVGKPGSYRSYYATAYFDCQAQLKAGSSYYLKDFEGSGEGRAGAGPSTLLAWSDKMWDQDYDNCDPKWGPDGDPYNQCCDTCANSGLGAGGGVNSASFTLTRHFENLCELMDEAQDPPSPYDPPQYSCDGNCGEEEEDDDFGYNKPFKPPPAPPFPGDPDGPQPVGPVVPGGERRPPTPGDDPPPPAGPEHPLDPLPCPDGGVRNSDGTCPAAVLPRRWPKFGQCRQICLTNPKTNKTHCYVLEFVGQETSPGSGEFKGDGTHGANGCPGCYKMVESSGGGYIDEVWKAPAGKCGNEPDPCDGKWGDPFYPACVPGPGIPAGGTCLDPAMKDTPQCRGGGSNIRICDKVQITIDTDTGPQHVWVDYPEGDPGEYKEYCVQGPVNPGSPWFCRIVMPTNFSRSCTEFGTKWEDTWTFPFTYIGPGKLFDYADVPRIAGATETLPTGWSRVYWEEQDTNLIVPPTFQVNGSPVPPSLDLGVTTQALLNCVGSCMHYSKIKGVWQLLDYLKCGTEPWRELACDPGCDPFNTVDRVNVRKAQDGGLGEGWHSGEDFLEPSEQSSLVGGFFEPTGFSWVYSNWSSVSEPGLWPAIDRSKSWLMATEGGNVQIPEVTLYVYLEDDRRYTLATGTVTSAWASSTSSPERVPVYTNDGWGLVEGTWVYDAADDGRVSGEGMGTDTGQERPAVFKYKTLDLVFKFPTRRFGVKDPIYQTMNWVGHAQGTKACRKRATFTGDDPAYDACILEASTSSLNPGDEGYLALFEEANRDYFSSLALVNSRIYYPEFVPEYSGGKLLHYRVIERSGTIIRFSENKYAYQGSQSGASFPGFPTTSNEYYMTVPFGLVEIDTTGDGVPDMAYDTWSYEDVNNPFSWSHKVGWVRTAFGDTSQTNPGELTSFSGCDVLDPEDVASAAAATHVRIKLLDHGITGAEKGETLRVPIEKTVALSYVANEYPCTTITPAPPGGGGGGGTETPAPTPGPITPPPLPPHSPPPPPFVPAYIPCSIDELCITFQDGINTVSRIFKRQSPEGGQDMFPSQSLQGRDWYIEKSNWPNDSAQLLALIETPQGPYYLQYNGVDWIIHRGTLGNPGYLAPINGTPPTSTDPCPSNASWPTGTVVTTNMSACTGSPEPPPEPPVVVRGCTDPGALNYVPWATEDDGSCTTQNVIKDPWGRDIKAVTIDGKVYEWIEQDCFRVADATNTSPIIVTTADHFGNPKNMGLSNGDTVIIDDVRGNTAANGVWNVENVGLNTLRLLGSTGNGEYFPKEQATDPSNPAEIHYLLRRCDLDMKLRMYVTGAPTGYDGIYEEGATHLGFKTYVHIADSDKKFYYSSQGIWTLARQGVPVAAEIWTSALFCSPAEGDWATGNSGMEVLAMCGETNMYVTNSNDVDAAGTGIYEIQDSTFNGLDAVTVITDGNGKKFAYPNYKQTYYLNGTPHPDGAGGVNAYFMGVGTYYSDQISEDPKITHWSLLGTVNKFAVAGGTRPMPDPFSIEACPHDHTDAYWGNYYSVSKDAP